MIPQSCARSSATLQANLLTVDRTMTVDAFPVACMTPYVSRCPVTVVRLVMYSVTVLLNVLNIPLSYPS